MCLIFRNHPKEYERSWSENQEWGLVCKENILKDEDAIEELIRLIGISKNIVGFTGAGVSTESGIPAYRTPIANAPALWDEYSISDSDINNFLASEECRKRFWKRTAKLWELISTSKPNPAHNLFAALQQKNKLSTIITQNIDGLHEKAGVNAEKIIELHGTTKIVECLSCHRTLPIEQIYPQLLLVDQELPNCEFCRGILMTKTVAYGMPIDAAVLNSAKKSTRKL